MNNNILNIENWIPGKFYYPNDCVLFDKKLYFCIGENNNNPITDNINWKNNLFFLWKPSFTTSSSFFFNNRLSNFNGSAHASHIKKNDNKPSFFSQNMFFLNRSDTETKSILAFIYSHQGSGFFYIDLKEPYNRIIKCKCNKVSFNFVYYNNNEIQAQFDEVL